MVELNCDEFGLKQKKIGSLATKSVSLSDLTGEKSKKKKDLFKGG